MKNKELSKIYDPSQVESKCYQNWEDNKLFAPSNNSKDSFEFSGHFHPKTIIKINNSSYSYKWFVVSRDFCILPSFGHFTGGIDVKSKENGCKIERNRKI